MKAATAALLLPGKLEIVASFEDKVGQRSRRHDLRDLCPKEFCKVPYPQWKTVKAGLQASLGAFYSWLII